MSRIPPPRRYTLQPSARKVSSSSEYAGDDPWVNELLNREIDFSKLIRQRPSIEIVNPRIDPIAYAPIRREIHHQYRLTPSTQHNSNTLKANSTSRTWIIDQTNQPNKHSSKHNSHKRSFDEEESLVKYQRRLISPRRNSSFAHGDFKGKDNDDDDDDEKSENKTLWNLYSSKEKRNILIYIIGIMLYKFGLEAFNGSIVSLAANRYDRDAMQSGMSAKTFEKVGLIIGLNQACQCIGSILIAPLIKRWPTRTVLSISIFLFSIFAALLMIIDGATGGKIKPNPFYPAHEHDYSYYGNYPTNLIIPIYCLTGIAYGMVELIRRIIPRDIVGSDEEKLQRMDALVHVFYEVAGVSGAFVTGLVLIPKLGNNYSFIITPILFTLSAIVWFFINAKLCPPLGSLNSHYRTAM
ncbi:unnamed protein product [Adineta ricciae]|uniref:Uncharacterized protein n=1 Tax=Adineta ricciae TaxID=249248 RepID=A0A814W4U4_ADIRI|nr:unnamed protein product [Adineta ricciae]